MKVTIINVETLKMCFISIILSINTKLIIFSKLTQPPSFDNNHNKKKKNSTKNITEFINKFKFAIFNVVFNPCSRTIFMKYMNLAKF